MVSAQLTKHLRPSPMVFTEYPGLKHTHPLLGIWKLSFYSAKFTFSVVIMRSQSRVGQSQSHSCAQQMRKSLPAATGIILGLCHLSVFIRQDADTGSCNALTRHTASSAHSLRGFEGAPRGSGPQRWGDAWRDLEVGDACREPPRDLMPGMREGILRAAGGCLSAALAAATRLFGFTFSPANASGSLSHAA